MPLVEGYNTTNNKNMHVHVSDTNRLKTTSIIESGSVTNDSTPIAVPTIYNITMTSANTEYSQALPANCKGIRMSIIDPSGADNYRVAFATGKVATPTAPYLKFEDGYEYSKSPLKLASGTVYFACSAAGKVMQIECDT